MSGLRTRKYVTLVAMLFASWSLIHITVNLRRQDTSLHDDKSSHSSYPHHSPSPIVPTGYRKSSLDHGPLSPPRQASPSDHPHKPAQTKDKDPDLPPPDAHILPPITTLKPSNKYLSYMTYAGLTNQVTIILLMN